MADLDTLLGRAGGVSGAAGGITEAQREELVKAITGADVDIWTGEKDHKLRRITGRRRTSRNRTARTARSSSTSASRGSIRSRRSARRRTRGRSPSCRRRSRSSPRAPARRGRGSGAAAGSSGPTGSHGRRATGDAAGERDAVRPLPRAAGSDLEAAQKCADLVAQVAPGRRVRGRRRRPGHRARRDLALAADPCGGSSSRRRSRSSRTRASSATSADEQPAGRLRTGVNSGVAEISTPAPISSRSAAGGCPRAAPRRSAAGSPRSTGGTAGTSGAERQADQQLKAHQRRQPPPARSRAPAT